MIKQITPVLAIVAAIFVAMAARSSEGRQRAAWLCLLVGVVGWGAGDVIWTYYELALNIAPFPSPADAAYLLLPVGACLALLLFPKDYSGQSRGRIFLDGVIVAASLLLVSWVTVLGPVYEAGAPDRLSFFVSLAYPVSDLVILTVAAVVLVRAGSAAAGARLRGGIWRLRCHGELALIDGVVLARDGLTGAGLVARQHARELGRPRCGGRARACRRGHG